MLFSVIDMLVSKLSEGNFRDPDITKKFNYPFSTTLNKGDEYYGKPTASKNIRR